MSALSAAQSLFSGPGGRARILLVFIGAACVAILLALPSPLDSLAEIRGAKAAGEKADWKDKVDLGEWLAAAVNLGLAFVLLLTARLWAKPLSSPEKPSFPAPQKAARWFWPLVLAAVVLAGALRINLAKKSLWWDELWNVKQASHGQWRTGTKHPDEVRFYPSDWARCAWIYQKPTNHSAIALGSKASLTLWRTFTGAPREEFSNLAVRLPALLAALLSVAMAAWVFRIWGLPKVGVIAAFLLAIHPYHIRYGVDVRGYTLVVLGTLLAIAGLSAIFRGRSDPNKTTTPVQKWAPWVLFGTGQLLLVWASVLVGAICATCFFIVGVALIFSAWKSGAERFTAVCRLAVVNVFAAMAFLQLFTPNVLQFEDALASDNVNRPINSERLQTTASQFLLGVEPVWGTDENSAGLVSLADRGGWPTAAALSILLFAGLFFLVRRRRAALWVLSATAAAAAIYIAYSYLSGLFYYHRFLIFFFTGIVLASAAGIAQVASWISGKNPARAAVSVALLGLFAWAAYPQIAVLYTRPYAPLRDVAEFLEEQAQGNPESITALGYGLGGRIIQTYYPTIKWASNDSRGIGQQGFEAEIGSARAARRPLYVFVGYDAFNRLQEPWGYPFLDDANLFEPVRTYRGIEPDFTFRILKLKENP